MRLVSRNQKEEEEESEGKVPQEDHLKEALEANVRDFVRQKRENKDVNSKSILAEK